MHVYKSRKKHLLFVDTECILGMLVDDVADANCWQDLDKVRQKSPIESFDAFTPEDVSNH